MSGQYFWVVKDFEESKYWKVQICEKMFGKFFFVGVNIFENEYF